MANRATNDIKTTLPPTGETPGNPNLNGTGVEKGKSPLDLSASLLEQFQTPVKKKALVTERAVEQVSEETCRALLISLQNQHQNIVSALKAKGEQEATFAQREKEITEQTEALKILQQKANAGVTGVLDDVSKQYKLDRLNSTISALHLIQHSLPALEIALQKASDIKSKNEFFQTLSTVIGNAMKNALLTGNDKDLEALKKALGSSKISDIFGQQASAELLQYVDLTINAAKLAPVAADPTMKSIWMNRFYNSASALYPVIAASSLYAAGQAEASMLSFTPEFINNFVSAVQEYVGSPTVPLLLFAVGYMIYYAIQLGYAGKDRFLPADAATKKAIEDAATAKIVAQYAITV